MMTLLFWFSVVVTCIWLATLPLMVHSQSVCLMLSNKGGPPCPRPLSKQVLNRAKSKAGLVPTNMLLPSGATFVTVLQVNVRPRRKGGCIFNGKTVSKKLIFALECDSLI